MQSRVVRLSAEVLLELVERMSRGEVALVPTELSYTFVFNALDGRAAARALEMKQIPPEQIVPVGFLSHPERVERVGALSSPLARRLVSLWPAAVSLMLPRQSGVPQHVTPYRSVAVSCPDRFCFDLAAAAPFAIGCFAANRGGEYLVTRFEQAMQLYDGKVPFAVDGGVSLHGIASTMVDCTITPPAVSRYGPFKVEDLRRLEPELAVVSHLMK